MKLIMETMDNIIYKIIMKTYGKTHLEYDILLDILNLLNFFLNSAINIV
jgi:hypothetical protein